MNEHTNSPGDENSEEHHPVPVVGSETEEHPAEPGAPFAFRSPEPEPPPPPPIPDETPFIERPREELLLGIVAALLAISVFFPWYKANFRPNVSGWASGWWGPLIFFLALAALAIVVLRRLRVPVVFPFDHSLVLEGIGWVGVLGMLLKRLRPISGYGSTAWVFVPLVLAIGLALLAERVSTSAPLVVRPGWFRARAGKLGASVLAVALVLGVAFGATNNANKLTTAPVSNPSFNPSKYYKQSKGFPPCAKSVKFPLPPGFTALNGVSFEQPGQPKYCLVTMETSLALKAALDRYRSALTKAGWTFKGTAPSSKQPTATLSLTKPNCGTVTFTRPQVPAQKNQKTQVSAAFFDPCPKTVPSP